MLFQDRREAGRVLARALDSFRNRDNVIVLALPRGGVPVAYEVACALRLPLDIFIVRKLGTPGHEELAMGAIASGGTVVINRSVVNELGIPREQIEAVAEREKAEIERREREYRNGRPPLQIDGRAVILIDDGLATGASMRAAARALRPRAQEVIVAVPVASEHACEEFRSEVDQVVCAVTPEPFYAVGMFYRNFEQTTDSEVRDLLSCATSDHLVSQRSRADDEISDPENGNVLIPSDRAMLQADLTVPRGAKGVVLFAHGSGSSRHSTRNQRVAKVLQEAGLATLLFDLLTEDEESLDVRTAELRFNIDFLARRLLDATDWLRQRSQFRRIDIGYFGASTGAGAALLAASERAGKIAAIVSRGGRPDLAGPALRKVDAPTLLIVGSRDSAVLEMNREALQQLNCEKRLAIVPGATHLFEEPGALDQVALLARDWFDRHVGGTKDEMSAA
ncbi:MAG TPA: phosphoribosyltransferase family protein [Terriglobales bacterium]|nr:phosphoribosyltransferase family protein [Terriglobales bacterium]